jgi:hypothetical protein
VPALALVGENERHWAACHLPAELRHQIFAEEVAPRL